MCHVINYEAKTICWLHIFYFCSSTAFGKMYNLAPFLFFINSHLYILYGKQSTDLLFRNKKETKK